MFGAQLSDAEQAVDLPRHADGARGRDVTAVVGDAGVVHGEHQGGAGHGGEGAEALDAGMTALVGKPVMMSAGAALTDLLFARARFGHAAGELTRMATTFGLSVTQQ
jgi:hypothetical protein